MKAAEATHDLPPLAPLAALLSYLVPGLGQIVQGRVAKGVLFMVALLGMFFFGQAMGNWRNVYIPNAHDLPMQGNAPRYPLAGLFLRWHYAGQFFIGVAAWPAIYQYCIADPLSNQGDGFWQTFQRGPRNFQDEQNLNNFIVQSDKTPDLGWVYTVIAGMLNILVIYDAFAGPVIPGHVGGGAKSVKPASPAAVSA